MEEFDKVIGLDQIAVFHINDSMNPLGAHKDRHANIDKGSIGYETLHRLVHDERFIDVPKILETPWLAEEGSDKYQSILLICLSYQHHHILLLVLQMYAQLRCLFLP